MSARDTTGTQSEAARAEMFPEGWEDHKPENPDECYCAACFYPRNYDGMTLEELQAGSETDEAMPENFSEYYIENHAEHDREQCGRRKQQEAHVKAQNGFTCACCQRSRTPEQWEYRENESRLICSICVGNLKYADFRKHEQYCENGEIHGHEGSWPCDRCQGTTLAQKKAQRATGASPHLEQTAPSTHTMIQQSLF